jgi:RES domain-containing protein
LPRFMAHRHTPIYRVVRQGWQHPIDASYSQRKSNNRWNTREFPALYACCSVRVARAVALDRLRFASVVVEDLPTDQRPILAEIAWSGHTVDMTSKAGVAAAGFSDQYPKETSKESTRNAATKWHAAGLEGVVCRSASMERLGESAWNGPHQHWSECAIFPRNSKLQPRLLRRRMDTGWIFPMLVQPPVAHSMGTAPSGAGRW